MSHVAELSLRNWGPFRGEHRVELGPDVYAVVGRRDGDQESSNWVGKSWLLAAIRFALLGVRPEECRLEDDWITRGEDDGAVQVALSCGLVATRSRRRGRSTEVTVAGLPAAPGFEEGVATGRHALDALAAYLAVTAEDFEAGPWVGQRDVARLVLSTPGDRARLVEGWLELGPLRAAEKHASDRCSEHESERAEARAEAERHHARARELLEQLGAVAGRGPAELRAEADEASAEADRLSEELARAAATNALVQASARHRQRRDQLVRVVEQLQPRVDGRTGSAAPDVAGYERAAREKLAAADAARREVVRLRALVHGDGFDGKCPVTCDECPVADDVRERGRRLDSQVRAAAVAAREAREAGELAEAALGSARDEVAASAEDARQLSAALAELAAAPDGSYASPVDDSQVRADRVRYQQRARELEGQAARCEQATAEHARAVFSAQLAAARADLRERDARAWAQAAAVLRGARREVAEGVVGQVEYDANEALRQSGADLSVVFRWEREGGKLASNCHKCGAGYPRGQAARRCERCGAERGQQLIEALELVPSSRSGAAEDLAGLWVQLSAAAWLRDRRGSPVNFVVVDEPFAHLDPVNARQLGARVHRALTGQLRFEQAFVVAHTAAVTEAMPRRLVVRAGAGGSRLEVE